MMQRFLISDDILLSSMFPFAFVKHEQRWRRELTTGKRYQAAEPPPWNREMHIRKCIRNSEYDLKLNMM